MDKLVQQSKKSIRQYKYLKLLREYKEFIYYCEYYDKDSSNNHICVYYLPCRSESDVQEGQLFVTAMCRLQALEITQIVNILGWDEQNLRGVKQNREDGS